MGLNLEYIPGQRINSITARGDLDEFEQLNIEKAIEWTMGKNLSVEKILTVETC